MVECEGALQPVRSEVAGVPVATDIVDQHVDPRQALEDLADQTPHLRLRGQVRDEHVHAPAAGRADLPGRGLGVPAVSADDGDLAPNAASPRAVARPMPDVAPVTRTVWPVIGPPWLCSMVALLWCPGTSDDIRTVTLRWNCRGQSWSGKVKPLTMSQTGRMNSNKAPGTRATRPMPWVTSTTLNMSRTVPANKVG